MSKKAGKSHARIGRPRKIESPEAFVKQADAYFSDCEESGKPVTITGLALALGFTSRQGLYDYEKREPYSGVVKRARMVVEHCYELRLQEPKPTGAIFALKNMGWSDRRELTGADGQPLEIIATRRIVDPENAGT